jgi:feruloyl-CoA synthase
MAACRDIAGLPENADIDMVLASREVRDTFASLLKSFAEKSTGSSTRIERLLLLAEPPSIDRGELTDKGSLNQRAVLRHHNDLVEELHNGSANVICSDAG